MKAALVVLFLIIVVAAIAHHPTHPAHPAGPVAPATAHPSASSAPVTTGPGVIDGEIDDDGADPYTAYCAGSHLVSVHPDTPAHRQDAARLCAETEQDWQSVESVVQNGGSGR